MRLGSRLLVLLFLGGVVLPSAVLSFLSFRSIRNEALLAEKRYEEDAGGFRRDVLSRLSKERERIVEELRGKSVYLLERPVNLMEMEKAQPLGEVHGVKSIFLFVNSKRVYPAFGGDGAPTWSLPELSPDPAETEALRIESGTGFDSKLLRWRLERLNTAGLSPEARTANLIAIARLFFKAGDFLQSLRALDAATLQKGGQSYLSAQVQPQVLLMRFRILVAMGNRPAASALCIRTLSSILASPPPWDITSMQFTMTAMLDEILSFDDLPQEARERFWNIRRNLEEHFNDSRSLTENLEAVTDMSDLGYRAGEGSTIESRDDIWFLRLSHPLLPGDQVIIALLDKDTLAGRTNDIVRTVAREYREVPYSLSNERDSTLVGRDIAADAEIFSREQLGVLVPGWHLSIHSIGKGKLRGEVRRRMWLYSSLVAFSVLVLIVGSWSVLQGVRQERRLLTMKSNFLSSVSHELKTPLTSIRMFSEMMSQGRVRTTEKVSEYSGLIVKESQRLESLIQAILDYTRMEHGRKAFQWERIDLADATSRILDGLKRIAQSSGIDLISEIQGPAWIMGDHTAVHSLVQNLVDNAIKYTPPPGEVSVLVASVGNSVMITVTDTGIGIPASEQKHIFDDFYRVGDEMTRTTKGSGLGLAIVRRVAEEHHASISLQSKPGKGSSFTVRFRKAEDVGQQDPSS